MKNTERKENQLKRQINYIVNKYNLSNNYSDWENYDNDFDEITKIHSVEYSIFTIQGAPLFYSYLPLDIISNNYSLDKDFANMLVANDEGKFTSENLTDVGKFQASYSVLKNDAGEKYAILFFPYFQDVSFAESELNVFFVPINSSFTQTPCGSIIGITLTPLMNILESCSLPAVSGKYLKSMLQ